MTISHTNPIYFPLLMSNYTSLTNEEVAGQAYRDEDGELVINYKGEDYCQTWAQSDTIRMQIHVDAGEAVPTVRIDYIEQGIPNSTILSGVPVIIGITTDPAYYEFNISLAAYSGEFTLTVIQNSVDIDTSVRNQIVGSDCLYRTRLIEYAHLGCGDNLVNYGGDIDNPTHFQSIRLDFAMLSFAARESDAQVTRNTDRTWNLSARSTHVVETLETIPIPDYMHRLLSWIFLHKHVKIDGTRFIYHSDWQAETRDGKSFLRKGSGELKLYTREI